MARNNDQNLHFEPVMHAVALHCADYDQRAEYRAPSKGVVSSISKQQSASPSFLFSSLLGLLGGQEVGHNRCGLIIEDNHYPPIDASRQHCTSRNLQICFNLIWKIPSIYL